MLSVEGLGATTDGKTLLRDVSLSLAPGDRLAIVGASGSGKSLTARAMLALPPIGVEYTGAVRLDGLDLLRALDRAVAKLRGPTLAMVFQEPATALNPVKRIGTQIAEPMRLHTAMPPADRAAAVLELLERTGLTAAGVGPERYPHELSGGQRQRVALAIAVALSPRVVVADEPTSALDAVTGAHVLDLLERLTAKAGTALVLITHDLAVAGRADRVIVMADGRVAEEGPRRILHTPESEAGHRLLSTRAPELPPRPPQPTGPPVLQVKGLTVRRGRRIVVEDAGFTVASGERIALVGGSGSGKTTLVRAVLGLMPYSGEVRLRGEAVAPGAPSLRNAAQMVFQDPATSFNPRHTVKRIITEPLHGTGLRGFERRQRAEAALVRVGLPAEALGRRPHAFSGGQRQRIAIARALIASPAILVADEPVSALDASLRAQIVTLFDRLCREGGLALIFIAHDLALVRALADRILVMDRGRVVEEGSVEAIFTRPQHEATRALVEAANMARSSTDAAHDGA